MGARLRSARLIALCVVAALTLTACNWASRTSQSASSGSATAGSSAPTGQSQPGPLSISLAPANEALDVSPAEPVVVRAENGKVDSVSLTNPEGEEVGGALSEDGTTWTSAEPLGYGRRYTITAAASSLSGETAEATASFTTVQPAETVFPSFFPPPSMTQVGVGQPMVVIFDKPPPDKVAAEKALTVTAVPATEGGWYWWDERTLHWRPKEYWKPGTKVTVDAKVYGVNLGDGMYGETDRTLSLTIGDSKIATIDDLTKLMTVYINGQVVREIPVSMGRDESVVVDGQEISFVTPSGTYVAQEKYEVKQMSSATYGLPTDYAVGYDSAIPLAVRLSNSGIFVHSAPWSVEDQGVRNVSHGCININPEAGQWFYDTFGYGDVVTISNTSTQLAPTDGFGDWNVPWEQWLEGSALR